MSAEEEGEYSWKFSPTDGMFMYNGSQSTTPVLKVDANGLNIQGNATFTGIVNASEGWFGDSKNGWKIGGEGFTYETSPFGKSSAVEYVNFGD
jgi:hypothetical protein